MSYFDFTTNTTEMQDILNETLEKIAERVEYKNSILSNFENTLTEKQFRYLTECGDFIGVNKDKKIVKANFCKNRLCPVCNRRYSAQKWAKMKNISNQIKIDFNPVFALFTVTVKNVKAEMLSQEITRLMKSIDRMHKSTLWKQKVIGYFRSLEITYNQKENTYHPHYHYILALPTSYTEEMTPTYIWRQLWERSARLNYNSQIDIRIINEDNLDGGIAEVAKYAVKISSVITQGETALKTVQNAIKGRRVISYGGVMKQYAQEFDNLKDEDYDPEYVEHYEYNRSTGQYQRTL